MIFTKDGLIQCSDGSKVRILGVFAVWRKNYYRSYNHQDYKNPFCTIYNKSVGYGLEIHLPTYCGRWTGFEWRRGYTGSSHMVFHVVTSAPVTDFGTNLDCVFQNVPIDTLLELCPMECVA